MSSKKIRPYCRRLNVLSQKQYDWLILYAYCCRGCPFTKTLTLPCYFSLLYNDDVIRWKHFPRYWLFVRGIHWSLVVSPHKGQWRRALMFSLISAWTNGWTNNRDPGDLRRCPARNDVTVMFSDNLFRLSWSSSFHRLLPMTVIIMDIIFEKKIIKIHPW